MISSPSQTLYIKASAHEHQLDRKNKVLNKVDEQSLPQNLIRQVSPQKQRSIQRMGLVSPHESNINILLIQLDANQSQDQLNDQEQTKTMQKGNILKQNEVIEKLLNQEIQKLMKENIEQQSVIEKYKSDLNEKNSQVNQLQQQLEQKTQKIETLLKEIEHLLELVQLKNQEDKSSSYRDSNSSVQNLENNKIDAHELLKQKNTEIFQLKLWIKSYKNKLSQDQNIKDKDEIQELKQAHQIQFQLQQDFFQKQIDNLNKIIKQKDQKQKNKKVSFKSCDDSQQEDNPRQSNIIENLKDILEQKDQKINELQSKHQSEIEQLQEMVKIEFLKLKEEPAKILEEFENYKQKTFVEQKGMLMEIQKLQQENKIYSNKLKLIVRQCEDSLQQKDSSVLIEQSIQESTQNTTYYQFSNQQDSNTIKKKISGNQPKSLNITLAKDNGNGSGSLKIFKQKKI